MLNFEEFILNEKLGINSDLIIISDYIYSLLIKFPNENSFVINGKDIKTEKIIIDKIHFNKTEIKDAEANFNIKKSKITNKGIVIYINFNLKKEINKITIYHEIQHSLDFYYKGKEKTVKETIDLKSVKTALNHISNDKIKLFILALYYSETTEINARIAETYKILLDKITINDPDEKYIREIFVKEYVELKKYLKVYFLQNYNIYNLKEIDLNDLLIFFNIIDDNHKLLLKYTKNTLVNNFNYIILGIKDFLFKKYRYRKIKKRYKNIEDIDFLLDKYNNRFKKAVETLILKLDRLLSLLIEEKVKNRDITHELGLDNYFHQDN